MGLPAPAQLPLFSAVAVIDPDFLAALLERRVPGTPAELPGFALASFAGPADSSPRVLVPSPEHSAHGMLYEGITAEDWRRLDAYQGVKEGLYQRTHAEVVAPGERRRVASIYVPSRKLLASLAR